MKQTAIKSGKEAIKVIGISFRSKEEALNYLVNILGEDAAFPPVGAKNNENNNKDKIR
jgi:cell division protein FtsX